MKLKWPEDYQERVERIIEAKFDKKNHVYFLDCNFETIRGATDYIKKIQLMQKQLRQIKSELSTKIRIAKNQRPPRARKKDPWGIRADRALYDLTTGRKISDYQYVVLNVENIIGACEKQKLEIEIWIKQHKTTIRDSSIVREPIPDDVQIFVWNRDGGKCVKCGSQENLEFDHIIPFSKGGSNTARNIQLYCETCNRKKRNTIGG